MRTVIHYNLLSLKRRNRSFSVLMNRVNIAVDHFLIPGLSVSGQLKSSPEDFIVKETRSLDKDINFDATVPASMEFCELPLSIGVANKGIDDVELSESKENTEKLIAEFAHSSVALELGAVNKWLDRFYCSTVDPEFIVLDPEHADKVGVATSVYMDMPTDKKDRATIHQHLRQKFPYLRTGSTDASSSAHGNKTRFCPDIELFSLLRYHSGDSWRTHLCRDDVKALYRFLKLGPTHQDAFRGVTIGVCTPSTETPESEASQDSYLSRDTRTVLYKSLTAQFPCWGIKTLGDDGGQAPHKRRRKDNIAAQTDTRTPGAQNNNKSVCVFWKKKTVSQAQTKGDKRARGSDVTDQVEVSDGDCGAPGAGTPRSRVYNRLWHVNLAEIRPITLYIGGMLYKYDTEQFAAVQQLTESLRCDGSRGFNVAVSPHNIHFAGTKDKAAATYQHITITMLLDSSYLRKHVEAILGGGSGKPGTDTSASSSSPPKYPPVYTVAQRTVDTLLHKLKSINAWCDGESITDGVGTVTDVRFPDVDSNSPSAVLRGPQQSQNRGPQIALGNISMAKKPIQLGELWGNTFRIVLRNVQVAGASDTDMSMSKTDFADMLRQRMNMLCQHGFPNYFGSQRMGSSISSANNVIWQSERARSSERPATAIDQSVESPDIELADEGNIATESQSLGSNEANTMPIGPYVGLCVLQDRYEDAVNSVVMARPCSINRVPVGSDAVPVTIQVATDVHELFRTLSFAPASTVCIEEKPAIATLYQNLGFISLQRARMLFSHGHHYRYVGELHDGRGSAEVQGWRVLLQAMLEMMPPSVSRERSMIKGLLRYVYASDSPSATTAAADYDLVYCCMPYNMRTLYVSAYQSWVWNKAASHLFERRCESQGDRQSVIRPKVGDLMLAAVYEGAVGVHRNTCKDARVRVLSAEDVSIMTTSGSRDCAQAVVLPLPGRSVVYPSNEVGAFMKQHLRADGFIVDADADADSAETVTTAAAGTKLYPLKCSGAYRNVLQFVSGEVACVPGNTESDKDALDLVVKIKIPAGSYATAFLRELLCNNDLI